MRDNKNYFLTIIITICIIIMLMTIVASADLSKATNARSALIYEPITKTFLFQKNIDLELPMASTTKIMTGLLAIELTDPDEIITVGKDCVGIEGSSIYLSEGDTLTCRDLIYSLLLQSANDAATALAIKISGSVEEFAELMNRRAAELGLTGTHFDNPHGLDSETHYTTARDLALLSAEALNNPIFRTVVSTYKYSFLLSEKKRTVVNHNKLLTRYDGCIGVKTGYTKKCGRCLVSAAERDGVILISVTLDDPDDWNDHKNMFDAAFGEFERIYPESLSDTVFNIPVIGSDIDRITASATGFDQIKLIRRRVDPDIRCEVDIKPYAAAPIKEGDPLGSLIYYCGDVEIDRLPITADASAEKKSSFNLFDIFIR